MPGIDYTLGMKTDGFNSGVSGALSKLAGLGAKVAAITAGAGLAAGAGIGVLIAKSIGKAADMETLRTAFIPLLGGIKQAQGRMAELAAFAAATPFELPEIAMASKTLETLTRGALATGKGLELVGDLASGTNQPFSEIAVTVGRLYDGLDSGRPVGEALARLQELGAVSGEVRGEIEGLQQEGKKGKEVWAVAEAALSRFSGSMKLQSGTWKGLMSTLSDTIDAVMVKFGQPIMDALKPYLEGAITRIETLQAAAAGIGEKIGEALGVVRAAFKEGKLMELAGVALKSGFLEAVNALAKGIQAALAAMRESLRMSGLWGAIESVFVGIGKKFTATILEGISDKGFGDFTEDASRLRREGGAEMYFAKREFESLDLGGGAATFIPAFKKNFDGMADIPGLAEARKKLADTLGSLKAAADMDNIFREIFKEQQAASLVKPPAAAGGGAAVDAAARTGGTRPSADRLAQIGGYVGGAANGLANRVAERTAKGVEDTVKGLDKLLAYSMRSTGAFPEAVF